MEIDVIKLKESVYNYNNIIKKYDESVNNLYNEIKDASSYWVDNKSEDYFNDLQFEKREVDEVIANLKEISSLYEFVCENYEKIGKKIKYNKDYKNDVITSFNNLISELNTIEKKYGDLDINSYKKNDILKQQKQITSIKESIQDLQKKLFDKIEEVDQIERDVNKKLASINIKNIKEKELSKYM